MDSPTRIIPNRGIDLGIRRCMLVLVVICSAVVGIELLNSLALRQVAQDPMLVAQSTRLRDSTQHLIELTLRRAGAPDTVSVSDAERAVRIWRDEGQRLAGLLAGAPTSRKRMFDPALASVGSLTSTAETWAGGDDGEQGLMPFADGLSRLLIDVDGANGAIAAMDRAKVRFTGVFGWISTAVVVVLIMGLGWWALLPSIRGLNRARDELAASHIAADRVLEQYRETKKLLEDSGRIAKLGGWQVDLETMQPIWTDEVYRIHGVPIGEQPTIEEAINFYAPEVRETVRTLVERGIEHGEKWDREFPFITAAGESRWVRSMGVPEFEGGRCVRLSGVFQDITEVREAHRLNEVLTRRLRTATVGAEVGVWDYDLVTGELFWDETMHRMYGTDEHLDVPGVELWTQRLHPEDREDTVVLLKRALDGLSDFETVFRIQLPDEQIRYIRASATVERDDQGKPLRMIGINFDVTRVEVAATELARAKADAEHASHAKTAFLANMSHEIRTPMTSILGFIDILASTEDDDEMSREGAIQTIRENARHLMAIINDILDMSKIESGRLSVEQVEVDPRALLEEIARLVGHQAQGKGIEFRIRCDTPIPRTIRSDPTRLRQILMNLIGNAIKFTEVGSVEVRTSFDENTGLIRFAVVDTGVGMTPDQLERVGQFEAFTQADTSTTRKFGGTGLGLCVSKSLAELLGGSIEIQSIAGEGSVFAATVETGVRLSGSNINNDLEAGPIGIGSGQFKRLPVPSLEGISVLLVEDGPDNQLLLSHYLTKAGATVEIANHGHEALVRIQEMMLTGDAADVILMDMQMPVLDGHTATRRAIGMGCPIPIVALTAHALPEDRARSTQAGCAAHLTKPIDRDELLRTCAAFARRKAA